MGERYTAGELARRVGVSARTVRFYDKKELLKPVAYTEGGYRLYDSRSVLLLQKIKLLQYAGLSLEQISRMMASVRARSPSQSCSGSRNCCWSRREIR